MKKYTLFGFFILGFLIISPSFGFVAATDDDGDGIDDDFEESRKRDVEIEFNTDEFKISSHLRNGEPVDEIELTVKYDLDGLKIEVSYDEEFIEDDIDNTSRAELEFEVEFRKLIEYVDNNGNGLYDDSVDQFIQEVVLNSFQPAIYKTQALSTDTTLHYIIVNSTDGVFAAHIYLVEEFTIINDTFIAPTQTKIDIEIKDFNYLNGGSQLALYVKLGSEYDYEEDDLTEDEEDGYATNENGVITNSGKHLGFFTWKENASIDNVIMDVLVSALAVDDLNNAEQKLLLNYPRGNHIYHDPKIGIINGLKTPSNMPIVITGIVGSIIGVAIVALIIVRRRRSGSV
ncbi:MAG: hypothetical protein ACFE8N_03650 [Promethearchaeota archaeon]